MPEYIGESTHEHGSVSRIGILLANLGTPDGPDADSVRRFLAEFLWDPRVVEAPRWLWWLALHGVVLRVRPAKSAHAYRQIWTEQGSPLLVHSRALHAGVQSRVGEIAVALGMSYGEPSIPSALRELRDKGVHRLLVLPLYPQYSGTTTASVFDRVTRQLQHWRWIPELRFVTAYCDEPEYIAAITDSIHAHWSIHQKAHLLFSFHGIPRRYSLAGDPYHYQCQKTARLVADALGLKEADWSISFQSRVGREEWLKPYTDQLLIDYARQGKTRISVVCPGFATDCLETLEEIAIRNRIAFFEHDGKYFDYIPALNAGQLHLDLMTKLVFKHTQGWNES
jgi:protoporphyrin/coproporphyrin ferrochelatase